MPVIETESKSKSVVYSVHRQPQPAGHYTVEHRTHQGKDYLVVPVVMMVEGVHNGSHGPLLHTIEELGRFPASWNGMPILIDHPEVDGQNISANEPDVIDARLTGRVYNTRVDGVRLMAQAWLEEEKLRQLSAVILAQIEAGEPIEVSLGMFTEELTSQGEWNGEQYEGIARNHRPDHLALLPGGLGACSIEDGCGIRANSKKGGNTQVENDALFKVLKDANKDGYSFSNFITDESQGYRELVDAVRQKLDAMDSESSIHFLQEVYADNVIYEVRMRIGGTRLFKQGYTFNNGEVTLQGSPTEVHRKVEYVAMAEGSGMVRTKFSHKKSVKMAENEERCTPCVQKKVTALIGDGKGKFTETDRPWLETFSEDQLEKFTPTVIEKVVPKEVNVLSAEDKAVLDEAKTLKKQKRDANIKRIQDNSKDWTVEELNAMNDSALSKIAGMVKQEEEEVIDYSVRGGRPIRYNESNEEPLAPTGVTFK